MRYAVLYVVIFIALIIAGVISGEPADTPQTTQEKNTDDDDKFLKELYENLPPQIKQYYSIPSETPAKPSVQTTPDKPKEPAKAIQKAEQKKDDSPQPQPKKEKDTFEKILDFLFGSKPQQIATPQAPPEQQKIERAITQEEHIEGLKPLSEIIENAKANSPEVKKAKIEAEIIKRQNTFTPVPTFQVGNDFATGKMLISAGVQIPLEPLFTGKQREQYGMLLVRQKELEVEQKVIDQYTVVKNTKERLDKRKKKLQYATQLSKIAEEQYKGGLIKLDELIKAKDALWQIEQDIDILEQSLKTEIEKLRSIEYGAR